VPAPATAVAGGIWDRDLAGVEEGARELRAGAGL
jgi:hypothetical protein